MTLICITNEMADIRSCTVKNRHTNTCNGFQYRKNEHGRDIATGRDCKGCFPREAKKGVLCWDCWERMTVAFETWPTFERMIAGIDRAVQRDNAGVRSQSVGWVNLTGPFLAVDEIRSYLRSYRGNPDYWVATKEGAADAVRFGRRVPAAVRAHSVAEGASKLRKVRCPVCGRLSFVRNPPEMAGALITVQCQSDGCGKQIVEGELTMWGTEKLDVVADIEAIA